MSSIKLIDNPITDAEYIRQFMDFDIPLTTGVLGYIRDNDDISLSLSDEELVISKVDIPIGEYSGSLSTETSYSSSETPLGSFELSDIALIVDGHLLNVFPDEPGVPKPPPDLPLKIKIKPPSVINAETEIFIADVPLILCIICYSQILQDSMVSMPCCHESYCTYCLTLHIEAQYEEGRAIIPCLSCNEILPDSLVFDNLGSIDKKKFTYMLVNARNRPTTKACTNCYHVVERTEKDIKKMKKSKSKKSSTIAHTTCQNCSHTFCFYCQAPWHPNLSCVSFQKGDGLFKNWMKKRSGNQANAHKCPRCKVPIQRISGCPNMTCSRCKTHWCYDCGKRKVQTIIFGGHESKWSIFGCDRYKFRKGIRYTKMVRGSVFIGEIGLISAVCLFLAPLLLALWPGLIIFGIPTLIGGIIYFRMVK